MVKEEPTFDHNFIFLDHYVDIDKNVRSDEIDAIAHNGSEREADHSKV
jgi:hypothetical protein